MWQRMRPFQQSMLRRVSSVHLAASSARAVASSPDTVYDTLVIGGGLMGVWTAIAAAKRGASVALAERFEPAHENGSSHGDGRIFRLAYNEDTYVDMMLQSLPLWRELQAFGKEPLMATTGGINISSDEEQLGFLKELAELYDRRGFEYTWLSPGECTERFPQYALADHMTGLYQPDFGVLFASKCIRAAWRYAQHLGVHTVSGFHAAAIHGAVTAESSSPPLVVENVKGAPLRAKSVVLAVGGWTSPMVRDLFGIDIPMTVTAETVCFYAPKPGTGIDHTYKSMPVFIPEKDNGLGPYGYYGLPQIDVPGIKASAHYCGPPIDPDRRPAAAGGVLGPLDPAEEAAAAARVAAVVESTSRYVASTFPHVEHTPFETASCLYTTTPDHDYILSQLPGHPRIVVAGGCSGHAFKMGPAIGEGAAALALQEEPPLPLERFRVDRLLGAAGPALAGRR